VFVIVIISIYRESNTDQWLISPSQLPADQQGQGKDSASFAQLKIWRPVQPPHFQEPLSVTQRLPLAVTPPKIVNLGDHQISIIFAPSRPRERVHQDSRVCNPPDYSRVLSSNDIQPDTGNNKELRRHHIHCVAHLSHLQRNVHEPIRPNSCGLGKRPESRRKKS